jgi:DNA-binding response OmpR family regulator
MVTNRLTRHGDLLVVDDDPTFLGLLREVLGDEGYRVLAVKGLAEAHAALAMFRVDLVLTDAFRETDDLSLWDGITRLRVAAAGVPVVICSAHTEKSFVGFAARGFAGIVPKPFVLAVLSAVVRVAIKRDQAAYGRRRSAAQVPVVAPARA